MNCYRKLWLILVLMICLILSGCESKAKVPTSAEAYVGTDYKQAVEELSNLGFVNIVTTEIDDLISTGPIRDGSIESISINGDITFAAEAKYPKDAEINITYHAFKRISPPLSSADTVQYDCESLERAFEAAGFISIKVVNVEDLTSETKGQEGTLHSISIGDTIDFTNKMQFPCNSEVIISLHTLKMVAIPFSSGEVSGSVFSDIKGKLDAAGFSDIHVTAIDDLTSKSATKDGTITELLILGENEFEKDAIVPHDAEVKITYHLIKGTITLLGFK